jgi:hypothetical protein
MKPPESKKDLVIMDYEKALETARAMLEDDENGVKYIVDLGKGEFTVAPDGAFLEKVLALDLFYRIHERVLNGK